MIAVGFMSCKSSETKTNNPPPNKSLNIVAAKFTDEAPFVHDTTKKYLYFTFDDGPQTGTMTCFHIAQELGVKASFFMIGVQIDSKTLEKRVDSIRNSYPKLLLCNHSFTHGNFNSYKSYYGNPDSAMHDVIKAQSTMDVPFKIFRTPANNSWDINGRVRCPELTKQLCSLLGNKGYEIVGWDVEWNFKGKKSTPVESADEMIRKIETAFKENQNFVRNNVVVLSHDRMFTQPQYADSLRKVISILQQDRSIVFETMNHYPGIQSK